MGQKKPIVQEEEAHNSMKLKKPFYGLHHPSESPWGGGQPEGEDLKHKGPVSQHEGEELVELWVDWNVKIGVLDVYRGAS